MRALLPLLALLPAACVTPWRPPMADAVALSEITPEGHLVLEDGRRVRLFGVDIIDSGDLRHGFVAVRYVVLPGEVPAVEAQFQSAGIRCCGNDPGLPMAEHLLWEGAALLNEIDLADRHAPREIVERLRAVAGR